MNEINKPTIIAIASVSGGGKTSVATHLAAHTKNSKALFFDEYELDGPIDVLDWVDRGADPLEWNLAPFVAEVEKLQKEPLDCIFLDFPFAYQHSQMKRFIHLAIYIDTPLDIALTRRMRRDFKQSSAGEILAQMKHYATHGRRGYLNMLETIRPDSDWIVDGTLSVETIANQILERCYSMNP